MHSHSELTLPLHFDDSIQLFHRALAADGVSAQAAPESMSRPIAAAFAQTWHAVFGEPYVMRAAAECELSTAGAQHLMQPGLLPLMSMFLPDTQVLPVSSTPTPLCSPLHTFPLSNLVKI